MYEYDTIINLIITIVQVLFRFLRNRIKKMIILLLKLPYTI